MRANQMIMGTGASLDVPGLSDPALVQKVFKRLSQIDNRYSPYKSQSELSRFRAGDLREQELSREFRQIMQACLEMEKLTEGFFSAWFDGAYNPTGYVKGWAIAQASRIIERAGHQTYCVGIGGDVNARSDSSKVWSIGLQDPRNRSAIVGRIRASTLAVATSGLYERGEHIVNPQSGQRPKSLLSVTVAGPDIILADVFATAVFVMGSSRGLAFIERQPGYEALIIQTTGKALCTTKMLALLS